MVMGAPSQERVNFSENGTNPSATLPRSPEYPIFRGATDLSDRQDSTLEASRWTVLPLGWPLLTLLVGIKLLLHVLSSNAYGFFRDELYFLDCARHMGWGYVDDAPLIAVYA